jgi:hypothetical protein|tara:strand:+ start:15634 stop:15840 length:207 start_codon:yes stop_codon:yes gene_type:complete
MFTEVDMREAKKGKGRPEAGKVYALTGGTGTPSIAAGNTWAESEVLPDKEGTRWDFGDHLAGSRKKEE